MGYYTKYELEIENEKGEFIDTTPFIKEIEKIVDYNPFEEPSKWYEAINDMKKISKKYPDLIFILYGKGEDPEDIWKYYFKNGKSQFAPAIIKFEEFDENKLK